MPSTPVPSAPLAPGAADPADWPRVIRPRRPFFTILWREVWQYRDLTFALSRRDITTSYKQTVLGPFWFVLQPLMITAVFSYLFGRTAKFGSEDIPHFLFYLGGLIPWGYFADTLAKTSNVFVENSPLFSKVYFPRLNLPLAVLLTNLLPVALQFVLFLIGLVFYLVKRDPHVHPTWWMLAAPLVFVHLGALALGLGCIISALSRRFRDLAMGVRVGLQLLLFGSAIILPLPIIKPAYRWLFFANPIVPPVEYFRYAFVGQTLVPLRYLILSAAVSFTLLFIGVLLFNRAEQNAMDTV